MATQTFQRKIYTEEQLTGESKEEAQRIIAGLAQDYVDRLNAARQELREAEKRRNKMQHEITRLERHIQRMKAFCQKHDMNITEIKE